MRDGVSATLNIEILLSPEMDKNRINNKQHKRYIYNAIIVIKLKSLMP